MRREGCAAIPMTKKATVVRTIDTRAIHRSAQCAGKCSFLKRRKLTSGIKTVTATRLVAARNDSK